MLPMNSRDTFADMRSIEDDSSRSSPSKSFTARMKELRPVEIRPFFGFYGGKWRDALKHYPPPKYDTIVEPFAGSAGYSVRYAARRVILCEVDPVLAQVWSYLTKVSPREILKIPDVEPGSCVDDLRVTQEAKWLIGLWLNRGVSTPRRSPSRWMRDGIRPGSFWGPRVRETIAKQVHAIRHWEIHNCSYENAPAPRLATWFIDPPYQKAGRHYRFGSERLDYGDLAIWCRARRGLAVVCENDGADWLPFLPLADVKTTRSQRRSKEVIWIQESSVRRVKHMNGHRRSIR